MVKVTKRFLNLQAFYSNQQPMILSYLKSNSSHRKKSRRTRQELASKSEVCWSRTRNAEAVLRGEQQNLSEVHNWFQRQYSWQMNKEYDTEFTVGVAAAAYAINSIEEDEARHRIKIERSRQNTTTRVQNSDKVTRRHSSKEIKTAAETSSRKSMEQDYRRQESTLPRSSAGRPMTMEAGDQRWKGNYSQHNVVETKADTWEKARLEKVNKRYENMKASILGWENEKKLRAKVKMDRRKKELEQRIKRIQQLYQAKIERIDHIAGGARAQADDKRRNEELKIKAKARKIRASGEVPVTCFCF
ncbi:hypothetical protein REPUB_Repub07fG0050300 [Reevesia pubescens]